MAYSRQHNRLKRVIRRVHMWIGLGLGGLFVLTGLTGSALVFYNEIDAFINPAIQTNARVKADEPVWETAYQTLVTAFPDKKGPWRFEVTDKPGAIPIRYYNPPETSDRAFAPMMVWLSPDGETVLRRDYWGDYVMTWIYDLHFRLQLEKPGGVILGYVGLFLTVLLLSGLWAWWPKGGQWRKAFRIKQGAVPVRRLYDWHKLVGLSGFVPLLMLTVTGVMLALPSERNWVLSQVVSPLDTLPKPVSKTSAGQRISVDEAVAAVKKRMPHARLAFIETPAGPNGVFKMRVKQPSDPSYRFPHSYVWVDQYDGSIMDVFDIGKANAANGVNNWLHPLHDGTVGGTFMRWVLFFTGFVPLGLFVTGYLRWRSRSK